jgi:deoxyribose-phosphate aldolase
MGFFYFYAMIIKQYLDSTYLKTPVQANLSEFENNKWVKKHIQEGIDEGFKLIMIRPEEVKLAHKMIVESHSNLLIGTVIDFPEGNNKLEDKLKEAQQAIDNNADELDFVLNYNAFIAGDIASVRKEIVTCAQLGLSNKKTVKFIIEVAALSHHQIIKITTLIKNTIIANFKESCYSFVFVKSSTGFYKTKDNSPNGASIEAVILMLENAFPLPIKAAGGIRSLEEAILMINLGVKRIGTSTAKAITDGNITKENY